MSPQLLKVIERLTPAPTPHTVSVTVRTAGKMLGVSESTVKRMIRSGQVRSQRIRGRRLIAYDSLRNPLA
jgi:excisionase family DNA binding protein